MHLAEAVQYRLAPASGVDPLISGHDLLISADGGGLDQSQTFIYDLDTNQYLAMLPTGRGSAANFTDQSVAEISDNYLVTDEPSNYEAQFTVYTGVPEPTALAQMVIGAMALVVRPRRARRRGDPLRFGPAQTERA